MQITSNIAHVRAQLERLIVNVPAATKRALLHEQWKGPVIQIATGVLQPPLVNPEHQRFVDGFIQTVMSAPLQEIGFSLTMHSPSDQANHPLTAAAENNAIAGLNFGENQTLGDLVRLWVETPFTNRDDPLSGKDIQAEEGGKDFNKSDDQITNDLMWILTGAKSSPSVDAARSRLLPRLAAFAKAATANRLPPETVDLWLRAVLMAWGEMVRRAFPVILRQELHAMKK